MTDALAINNATLQTLKNTITRDCNATEFNLFIEYCKRIKLDPIRGQVVPMLFSKDDPKRRKMNIVVTIDGLRTIAERIGNYRPSEDEPEYYYVDELVNSDTNPLGIQRCVVTMHKQDNKGEWHQVKGVAYWDEFVPLYDGKIKQKTLWPSKPRLMLAKCAEAQALRKGWPDQFSGVYADAEFDSGASEELDATRQLEEYQQQQRIQLLGGDGIALLFDINEGLVRVPLGELADRVIEFAGKCETLDELSTFQARNQEQFNQFWAMRGNDCLEMKKQLEAIEATLKAKTYETAAPEAV